MVSETPDLSEHRSSDQNMSFRNEKPSKVQYEASSESSNTPSGSEKGDDETSAANQWTFALVVIGLCASIFCTAVDNTIIATAIPRITDEFHSLEDIGWYGSAYWLTTCAFQLFYGRLYTFFSIKWVFLTAFIIFEIGSVVCGAAPSSTSLIIGRAVGGVGSAGTYTGAMLIIAYTVPVKKRAAYQGLLGAMYGLASIVGPLLGGAFTDNVTWRWCFYINLPIGAITILFIALFFRSPQQTQNLSLREKIAKLDIIGTAIFVPSIVCLLLALQWGGTSYAWRSWRVITLLVVFGVLLLSFIGIQLWRQEGGTVPPRIIKQRVVYASSFFLCFTSATFIIVTYYLPIWFQSIQNASAIGSGVHNLPSLVAMIITTIGAGGLVTTFGHITPVMIAGSIFMSIGTGLLTTLRVNSSAGLWIGYQILFGIGVGFGFQQPLVAVQARLPLADAPVGTAVVILCQTLGGTVFMSVGQNVFTNQLQKAVVKYAPSVSPQLVLASGATELQSIIPANYLGGIRLAYNDAVTKVFVVSVVTACLTMVGSSAMEWKSIHAKDQESAGDNSGSAESQTEKV